MGSLFNISVPNLSGNDVKLTDHFSQFEFTKDPTKLDGMVSVETDFAQFPSFNSTGSAFVSNDGKINSLSFTNFSIGSFEHSSPPKLTIDASVMRLKCSGTGNYLDVEITGDFNLTIVTGKGGFCNISILQGQKLLNETFQGSNIKLAVKNNSSLAISVKDPTINVADGTIYFGSARIYRNHYQMPLFYDDGSTPFEIVGNASFKIKCSDNGVNFIDNFTFSGKGFNPLSQPQSLFTEMSVPWYPVLTSPLHLLMILGLSVVIISCYFYYKKCSRTKNAIGEARLFK